MATAESAPLPSEGGWAALLERIKGDDDSESLEPLAHQLYAAVSCSRPPPPLGLRAAANLPNECVLRAAPGSCGHAMADMRPWFMI